MPGKNLSDIAKIMKDIDFAMLSTKAENGAIASRPMSNNRDVEFVGDTFFFTREDARMVKDIAADPQVSVTYSKPGGFLGKSPLFIAVEGDAELIRDRAAFEPHWQPEFDEWFEQGIDTPGVVMIKIHAQRIGYWDGEERGDVEVPWLSPAQNVTSRTMLGAGTELSDS